jgi:hypothetical protein
MSQQPVAIPKHPALKPAEDYYRLRREGIGFIEQMGSQNWTDYNLHDPGITLLEALCYVLTDIGYRLGWDIKDLLAPADPSTDTRQPFFTAREILTVNPWTTDDFRRLLIDLDGVRNAWLFCKDCACDLHWYAWCENDQLNLGYRIPTPVNPLIRIQSPKKVAPQGLYEVLLELEADPESGDLNDRKIEKTFQVEVGGEYFPVMIELRFPDINILEETDYQAFLDSDEALFDVTVEKIVRSKSDNISIPDTPLGNEELHRYWRDVFFVTLKVKVNPGGKEILFENASMRLFSGETAKNNVTIGDLENELGNKDSAGFAWQYRSKLRKTEQQVADAKKTLQAHRNLDEDYCTIGRVGVEEVAVCCDVEVAPDADIERVMAQIMLEIELYFNPPVHFYFLQELLDEGMPVEEIFQGPALKNGFIKATELQASGLKSELRVSDILNRLMDIEGVVTVNNLLLTKYDSEGFPVKGAADLHTPVPNPDKVSAEWTLAVTPLHQPRLYFNLSRFLFYKNGLPFMPRMDEVRDTLLQLHGEVERPKIKTAGNDLLVPQGRFRNPEDYFPVQYSLPLTYGVGEEGLPSTATAMRRAQAKQLKAYLMPFEQILVNALAQVTHTTDLFSLDPTVQRTNFVRLIDEQLIKGSTDLFNGLGMSRLNDLIESETEFLERRNRFLDHLLARFGEQFKEYALLLTNLEGRKVALEDLIIDKISFLKAYPVISHDRARAFDYTCQHPRDFSNIPGLQRRVGKLLGHRELLFSWDVQKNTGTGVYTLNYTMQDELGLHTFSGSYQLAALPAGKDEDVYVGSAKYDLSRVIFSRIPVSAAYLVSPDGSQFKISLKSAGGIVLLDYVPRFDTSAAANNRIQELTRLWSEEQRMIVVEHLLLRPKFPGDALYPACSEGPCATCGDEDPYSFRLTFVMPGWTQPYNTNLDMRRFADEVIRKETPSHLLPKICWVGNLGYKADDCDPVVDDLTAILEHVQGFVPDPDCAACSREMLGRYVVAFKTVYDDNKYAYWPIGIWRAKLSTVFTGMSFSNLACLPSIPDDVITEINNLMLGYFSEIAMNSAQFSRFEEAWTAWLEADALIDWTKERLHDRVEAMVKSDILPGFAKTNQDTFCQCATDILTGYGIRYFTWLEQKIDQGTLLPDIGAIPAVPDPPDCNGVALSASAASGIKALLNAHYERYVTVSYRLRILLRLLANLDNTYPAATLHDCDDGSDDNPVRLGKTGLGMLRMQTEDTQPPQLPPAPPPKKPLKPVISKTGVSNLKPAQPAPKPKESSRSMKKPRKKK